MTKEKISFWLSVVNTILILAVLMVGGNQSSNLGGITNYDQVDAADGFSVDETIVIDGSGNVDAPITSTIGSFSGAVTFNGGALRSYTNASTSVGSGTLQVSDVNGYDTILLTPTGAAATKTLTFFASSTASTWLPTAGDMQETCFYNGTTTAATTITFAAGTGIDLETASSSPTDLILLAGNTACFKFMRQSATATTFDISALMTEYTNGD